MRLETAYDAGGLLERAVGHRTVGGVEQTETYLASLRYDEFGQRVRMVLGNGVATSYEYEPLTRRLSRLVTSTPSERLLQNISYGYDRVGNILTMTNGIGDPKNGQSGTTAFQYRYDDLYRLTWANGEARARVHTIDRFTAQYAYSDVHNMTSNVQLHEIVHGGAAGVSAERPPRTNHEFAYTYSNPAPHQATRIGETLLVYDANGNTVKECRDHGSATCDVSADRLRSYEWTEENRLDRVIDAGGMNVTRFIYDAGGDRVVKLGRGGESVTIGQFWSLKGRRAATKHIFAGATRLASKVLPPPGWTPTTQTLQVAPTAVDGNPVGEGVPNENGCDPAGYNPQKCPVLPGGTPVVNHFFDDTTVRPETYYYHPDHLGSTSWVTDGNGRVHEHVEYFPYGEVWRDPRSDSDGGPVKGQRFLFTGKELDEETGLVYFGARYYEPRRALWLSGDPLVMGEAGALRGDSRRASVYLYAGANPVGMVDRDGRDFEVTGTAANVAAFEAQLYRATGIPVKRDGSGNIRPSGKRDPSVGSAVAAKILTTAMESRKTIRASLVNGDAGTIIDSFVTGAVDVDDIRSIEARSPKLAAYLLSHLINERARATELAAARGMRGGYQAAGDVTKLALFNEVHGPASRTPGAILGAYQVDSVSDVKVSGWGVLSGTYVDFVMRDSRGSEKDRIRLGLSPFSLTPR
jgi:RHS repeat-associated protein